MNYSNFLQSDINTIKGVGTKTRKYLQKKKIEKVKDLLWDLPYSIIDRSKITSLDKLEIGKILTIKVHVLKYNFPRIRNLPNTVICGNYSKKIKIVFFNSFEGYIRKILPLNKTVIISGKINYYKNSYQITNPTYVKPLEQIDEITKIFPKYSLTEGLLEKNYRKLITNIVEKIDDNFEWHENDFLQKNNFKSFKKTLNNLHNPKSNLDVFSNDFRRLAYDEILSNLLALYSARKVVKIRKKRKKAFKNELSNILKKNFKFELTKGQNKILSEIDKDLKSNSRMFRLLQGDVGSGKTILALIAFGLVYTKKKNKPMYNTMILSFMMLLIGYSSFAVLVVRSNSNPPIDENNPEDAVGLLSYLKREQYGSWPIVYGQYFNAKLDNKKPYLDGNPVYAKDEKKGKYVIIDDRKNSIPNFSDKYKKL